MSGAELLIGLVNLLVVLFLVPLRGRLRDLEKKDEELNEKLGAIALLVSGQYLRRDEFHQAMKNQTDTTIAAINKVWDRVDKLMK